MMKESIVIASVFLAFGLTSCASNPSQSEKTSKQEVEKEATTKKASEQKSESSEKDITSQNGSMMRKDCKMKNDERFVETRKTDSGCELAYSKFGKEEIVASSMKGTQHCDKILKRIVSNLEDAGFTCE